MMLYTFAFFRPPTPAQQTLIESLPGIRGSLQVYATQALAAAVEFMEDVTALQTSDQVLLRSALCHDQVIQTLFAQFPVLPVRFGTCFPSRDHLITYLEEQGASLTAQLSSLDHRAEYVLKILVDPPPQEEPGIPASGTDYLLARKHRYWQQQQFQERRQAEQEDLERLWPPEWPRRTLPPQEQEWGRYAFLLTPAEASAARTATAQWQQRYPHWQILWTSPLPPYHWLKPLA